MPLFKDGKPGSGSQRKREERKPVFADATLVTPAGKVRVAVTNVSPSGARVDFTAKVTLEGDIVLVAPSLGINRRVRIAWQRDTSAGLVFRKEEKEQG